MAKFIPSLKEIKNNKMEKPTEGEWFLLQKLQALNDDYTIYFQSYINILHPDIVITAKGRGVMIIEVKDWNLGAYEFIPDYNHTKSFGDITLKKDNTYIKNPFNQVTMYKKELYDIIPELHLQNCGNKRVFGLVHTAIFYYKAKEMEVNSFFKIKSNTWNYVRIWGRDSENILYDIEKQLRENTLFSDKMYLQVKAFFKPSLERIEQAKPFKLSNEQKKFTISERNKRQKIKGVAGSGKTLVLAQRAVKCFERTKSPVLILTFNITLRHYIRDKISQITRDFSSNQKKQFHIIPIFDFIKIEYESITNKQIHADSADAFIEAEMEVLKKKLEGKQYEKYKTILIDEVQDFRYEWLVTINELFLDKEGEFVLFGDEQQNVYDRELENRLPRTNIKGAWSKLKETYRLTKKNTELALQFQKRFFTGKYEENDMNFVQMDISDILTKQETRYYDISDSYDMPLALKKIVKIIEDFRIEGEPTALNDICILSSEHEMLRELEFVLRTEKRMKTTTITETKEEYKDMLQMLEQEENFDFDIELYNFRKVKKKAFEMNAGVMKLCTIHSFKGWEINTIFLILGNKDDKDELIYTAITRAKKNLIIINYNNDRYKEFFEENLDIGYIE